MTTSNGFSLSCGQWLQVQEEQGLERGLFFGMPVEAVVAVVMELFFPGLPAETEAVSLGFFFLGLLAE